MINLAGIESIYLVGIGGIGMSALARYFLAGGYRVGGYDRTSTMITDSLRDEGCTILFEDRQELIPREYLDASRTVVIFTPAIPAINKILAYYRNQGFRIYKRSEILGDISLKSKAIAISGTHGKTTITTLTAHLLKQSHVDCSAFLGGISKNYNTNLLLGEGDYSVMEADEYDRSFLRIVPEIAMITSVDPDHLEIYGDYGHLLSAFNEFAARVRKGGSLVVNRRIREKINRPEGVSLYTYGLDQSSDFRITGQKLEEGSYIFDIATPFGPVEGLVSTVKGKGNLENVLGAISLAMIAGAGGDEIRKALVHFSGVVRRFDVRIDTGKLVYIDDYAHHPEELNFCIGAIREFYSGRKITGIFQPHLFTRTRDYADQFAESLDRLDRVILLPVYPAREEPIKGVSSEMIFERMKPGEKYLMNSGELLESLAEMDIEVLVTIGAGDIDRLVAPIENILVMKR